MIPEGGAEYIPGAMLSQLEITNRIYSSHLNSDGIRPDDG
jgi:hypothetical protein